MERNFGLTKWKLVDGSLESVRGGGYLISKQEFGSCRLHVEFATPKVAKGNGQGRGNSGVFLMGQYYPFFKAYDVRARVPDELDADLARRIGRAYAAEIGARTVVVGRDMRLSSVELADALIEGLTAGGADVLDIGLCGTEEVYYVTFSQATDGGIMVTASHNPKDYNGLKFVREGARPISSDTGLFDIEKRTHDNDFPTPARTGERRALDHRPGYIDFLLGQIRPEIEPDMTCPG